MLLSVDGTAGQVPGTDSRAGVRKLKIPLLSICVLSWGLGYSRNHADTVD